MPTGLIDPSPSLEARPEATQILVDSSVSHETCDCGAKIAPGDIVYFKVAHRPRCFLLALTMCAACVAPHLEAKRTSALAHYAYGAARRAFVSAFERKTRDRKRGYDLAEDLGAELKTASEDLAADLGAIAGDIANHLGDLPDRDEKVVAILRDTRMHQGGLVPDAAEVEELAKQMASVGRLPVELHGFVAPVVASSAREVLYRRLGLIPEREFEARARRASLAGTDPSRGTGRTTRQLVDAVLLAELGHTVAFVTDSPYACDDAQATLRRYIGRLPIVSGRVLCSMVDDAPQRTRGLRGYVIFDHSLGGALH